MADTFLIPKVFFKIPSKELVTSICMNNWKSCLGETSKFITDGCSQDAVAFNSYI